MEVIQIGRVGRVVLNAHTCFIVATSTASIVGLHFSVIGARANLVLWYLREPSDGCPPQPRTCSLPLHSANQFAKVPSPTPFLISRFHFSLPRSWWRREAPRTNLPVRHTTLCSISIPGLRTLKINEASKPQDNQANAPITDIHPLLIQIYTRGHSP